MNIAEVEQEIELHEIPTWIIQKAKTTLPNLYDVEKSRLVEFEEKFYDFLDASCGDLLNTIKSSGQLDDSAEETLKTKITDLT